MKMSFEIYTSKVQECKQFYTQHFNFGVKFETAGFVVLQHSIFKQYELMFCIPCSPFVNPLFHSSFNGKGALLQMEVSNVEEEFERVKERNIPILIPLIAEPVNGYHFTISDPGGLLIDIVQFV